MIDIATLSARYRVRRMNDADADAILALCLENAQYYRYCGRQPSRELVLNDLHMTPPDTPPSDKYYVGFYDGDALTAIMDLIDGYPDARTAFIGFFMVNRRLQGRNVGTEIVGEVCRSIRDQGIRRVRLAIDKGNPQSTHFWKKNGFQVIREVERDGGTLLVAEKPL